MSGPGGWKDTPEGVAYRLGVLEVQFRTELQELQRLLSEHYLNREQLMNEYVPRKEVQARRREWPLYITAFGATVAALASVAALVLR